MLLYKPWIPNPWRLMAGFEISLVGYKSDFYYHASGWYLIATKGMTLAMHRLHVYILRILLDYQPLIKQDLSDD